MTQSVKLAARSHWRPWIVRVVLALLVLVVAGAIALYYYANTLIEQRLRPATIALLQERFDSEVTLTALHVRFAPTLSIRGEGLTLRHQGRTDIPPLISIRAFTISSTVGELWTRHIEKVHLEGLEIMIPPRRREDMPRLAPARDAAPSHAPDVYIHELLSEDSLLTIMAKREGKRPRVFQLRRIQFQNFQFDKATPFEADLTNPTPAGEIEVVGSFGPWQASEPRLTPLEGSFVFDADLGTIKGIGGALHADGKFSGPLEYIKTSGRTRTERFRLSSGGAEFPLTVDYDAIVDGTNGDTRLERVEGQLVKSHISARGAIVHVEGVRGPSTLRPFDKLRVAPSAVEGRQAQGRPELGRGTTREGSLRAGRRITLDTSTREGRLEDFIKLTTRVKSSPMTGIVNVKAKLDIPPGGAEVIERMDLDGTFDVASARFTSEAIQDRVDELSRRGIGRPNDETIDDVVSNLRGSFRLKDARMIVRSLSFTVKGAEVRLAGSYDIRSERLDFRGTLRLQAKVSQTQTGWKSFVLKVFDPLFDGDGAGTVLPITITGTRDNPKFGADIKKALLH